MPQGDKKYGLSATKGMNRKEKREFIWEYYKIHIIVGVLVIFFVLYGVYVFAINPSPQVYVEMSVTDVSLDDNVSSQIASALSEALIPQDMAKKYQVQVDNFYLDPYRDPTFNNGLAQKFSAMLVTNQIDLFVFGAASFQSYGSDGDYADLAAVLDPADLAAHGDQIVTSSFASPDSADGSGVGPVYACALKLDGNQFFASQGVDTDGMYLAVMNGAGSDRDRIAQAVKYIMGWD